MLNKFTIPRVANLSPTIFHRNFWRPQRPVILQDAISDWKALKSWSLEYFSQVMPEQNFSCEEYETLEQSTEPERVVEANRSLRSLPFHRIVDRLQSEREICYPRCKIFKFRPDLKNDVGELPLLSANPWVDRLLTLERPTLSIAPRGVTTPVHYDEFNNFVAQITGRKHWTVFLPKTSRSLNLPSDFTHARYQSPLRWEGESELRKSLEGSLCEFELKAGDLLFLPRFYPHHVFTEEISITLNYWVSIKRDLLRRDNLPKLARKLLYHLRLRSNLIPIKVPMTGTGSHSSRCGIHS